MTDLLKTRDLLKKLAFAMKCKTDFDIVMLELNAVEQVIRYEEELMAAFYNETHCDECGGEHK
jgi:hypothetical protein